MSSPPEDAIVHIPRELHDQIASSTQVKGFATVDDFVVYVLRVTMGKATENIDEEDTSAVTERLKRLGYI